MATRLFRIFCLFAFLLSGGSIGANATSIIPPEFDQLVTASDYIVRATVTEVHSEWRGAGDDRHIVTLVTLAVTDSIVGEAPIQPVLELLGGEVDGEGMIVTGQPKFEVGNDDFLFVAGNGRSFSPLVAMSYGRFLVASDQANQEFVARDNGVPLASTDEVATTLAAGASAELLKRLKSGQGLTPAQLASAIRATATAVRPADVIQQ